MTERTTFPDFVKNNYKIIGLVFVVLFIPFFIFFGVTGIKTFIGMIVFFFLPFFLIIYCLNLDFDEKLFFSLFLGLIIFSQLLWYIDRIVHNIYWSSVITGFLLYGIGIYLSIIKIRKRTDR